jgi:hypothetical protein
MSGEAITFSKTAVFATTKYLPSTLQGTGATAALQRTGSHDPTATFTHLRRHLEAVIHLRQTRLQG